VKDMSGVGNTKSCLWG